MGKQNILLCGICLSAIVAVSGCASVPTSQTQAESAPQSDLSGANAQAITNLEARSFFTQGLQYSAQKDYNNAILSYKKSIEIQPSAAAYSNIGVAYMQVGKINLAERALTTAVGMDPVDATARYNLAAAYSVMGKTDLSLEEINQSLLYGFDNYDAFRYDNDLDNVREHPQFRKVLERHKVFIQ